MTTLTPGESTTALTSQMTMKSISNAEYADIENIWKECKSIQESQ